MVDTDDAVDVESAMGIGAGVVAVGPGVRAALIVLETPVKSDEARFWLFENLSRGGEEEVIMRKESARRDLDDN